MRYEGRFYITIDSSDLAAVNFDEVMETSIDTVRKSNDGTKAILKFIPPEGQAYPESIRLISSKSARMSHADMVEMLSGAEWYSEMDV